MHYSMHVFNSASLKTPSTLFLGLGLWLFASRFKSGLKPLRFFELMFFSFLFYGQLFFFFLVRATKNRVARPISSFALVFSTPFGVNVRSWVQDGAISGSGAWTLA